MKIIQIAPIVSRTSNFGRMTHFHLFGLSDEGELYLWKADSLKDFEFNNGYWKLQHEIPEAEIIENKDENKIASDEPEIL